MSIFQNFPTQHWAKLVKSCKDDKMASTSNRTALEECPALPIVHFGPSRSPFCRLSRAITGS